MKFHQQPGYVLRRRPYSETSLLVDLFCRDHGRFMVIAKGARRQKSGVGGLLMPFIPLLFSWAGKGQLPILTMAESQGYHPLPQDRALQSGYYINELILKLLHRFDEHAALYNHYHEAIMALSNSKDASDILRVFEKQLLQEIGFGLVLDHDVETGEVISARQYYQYLPERGPVAVKINHHGQRTDNGSNLISGESLLALDTGKFETKQVKQQAKNLIRNLITHQLNGKPLRSRRILHQMLHYQNLTRNC